MSERGLHGCPTCTCGCTCGYGGQHEPANPGCALNGTTDADLRAVIRDGSGRPFELLMELVAAIPPDNTVTLGRLAREWNEPCQRIMDAIDAVKVCAGEPTYIAWSEGYGTGFVDARWAKHPQFSPAGNPYLRERPQEG